MIFSTERPARHRVIAAGLSLLLAACHSESVPGPLGPEPHSLLTGLEVSSDVAAPGELLGVAIVAVPPSGVSLQGMQGRLSWDPARLEYVGQPAPGRDLVLVNPDSAARGSLRVLSLSLATLESPAAQLRFRVRGPDYLRGLGYQLQVANTPGLQVWHHADPLPLIGRGPALAPDDTVATRLALPDWLNHYGLRPRLLASIAGQGAVYGDAFVDGIIDVLDAFVVANVAVGNRPLLADPQISNTDNAVAANVFPFNLPGLGEAGDPLPPGQEADGSMIIDVVDASAIANESVGNDRPVAGEPIPGRQPRPFRAIVSGDLTADRTFFRDTVYELQGTVNVPGSVTLTIQPGTLIEGDGASNARLVVRRGGNVHWVGTRLEPIVFTCTGAIKSPGCWGGVVINGLSLLNTTQSGGDPLTICPEKTSIGNPGLYGGCLVEDTSGVMRNVRIEYAGQAAGGVSTPGLALLGIGTGTVIERVQVHGSLGDGVFLSGGTVNLRYLILTANRLSGLHWDDGYGGSGTGGSMQSLVIQQGPGDGDAIRGSNSAAMPNAGPRAIPQLYHVTIVGAGPGGGSGRGIVFENGSGGAVRDAIILQTSGPGLDITGAESCAQVGAGMLQVDHDIFFGNTPDFAADADCIDEAAFATTPVLANRVIDPGLIAPTNTFTPDWRPRFGAPSGTGAIPPPSNLFFDVTFPYLGGVEPAGPIGVLIPWYAGWTRTWSGTP